MLFPLSLGLPDTPEDCYLLALTGRVATRSQGLVCTTWPPRHKPNCAAGEEGDSPSDCLCFAAAPQTAWSANIRPKKAASQSKQEICSTATLATASHCDDCKLWIPKKQLSSQRECAPRHAKRPQPRSRPPSLRPKRHGQNPPEPASRVPPKFRTETP